MEGHVDRPGPVVLVVVVQALPVHNQDDQVLDGAWDQEVVVHEPEGGLHQGVKHVLGSSPHLPLHS